MKAGEVKLRIQELLLIPESDRFMNLGPKTTSAFDRLRLTPNDHEWLGFTPRRRVSQDGLDLVMHFESLFLESYKDPVGIWTIGWGHTGLKHRDGTVFPGRKVTIKEAQALLEYDMLAFENVVSINVKIPLNDDEFSALVSFTFNVGGGALASSTLLRKLNESDRLGAAEEFRRWNKAGGQVLNGLTRRRSSERNLFLSVKPAIVT